MNLFKIVQKRTDKSSRKSSPYRDAATMLLFVFLLPYVISCLWGHIGEETENMSGSAKKEEAEWIDEGYELTLSGSWGSRRMSMQEYLIRKLEIVLGKEEGEGAGYEFETLKAQAVLLRTELWGLFSKAEEGITIQDDVTMYEVKPSYEKAFEGEAENVYERAVHETDGLFLAYNNQPVKAAFFPVSGGYTRTASEVWENAGYPYLVSVECSKDIMSDDYQSQVAVPKDEYIRIIKGIYDNGRELNNVLDNEWKDVEFIYDSAGYVVEAEVDGKSCSGEAFRNAFGLNSANFQAEWKEEEVVFHVKGLGHGFGMSQYGANERAVSGESFDQILKYYFFQTELAKIE